MVFENVRKAIDLPNSCVLLLLFFAWDCHVCHEGVLIPGKYKNIHGEIVKIDPNTEVMHFLNIIPLFHHSIRVE